MLWQAVIKNGLLGKSLLICLLLPEWGVEMAGMRCAQNACIVAFCAHSLFRQLCYPFHFCRLSHFYRQFHFYRDNSISADHSERSIPFHCNVMLQSWDRNLWIRFPLHKPLHGQSFLSPYQPRFPESPMPFDNSARLRELG